MGNAQAAIKPSVATSVPRPGMCCPPPAPPAPPAPPMATHDKGPQKSSKVKQNTQGMVLSWAEMKQKHVLKD